MFEYVKNSSRKFIVIFFENRTGENGARLRAGVKNSDFPSGKSPVTVEIIQF